VGVNRFEDLRVWQAAKEQCDRVGELLQRPTFRPNGELKTGYYVADGRAYLVPGEKAALTLLNESIAKMLRRWYTTLTIMGGGPGT